MLAILAGLLLQVLYSASTHADEIHQDRRNVVDLAQHRLGNGDATSDKSSRTLNNFPVGQTAESYEAVVAYLEDVYSDAGIRELPAYARAFASNLLFEDKPVDAVLRYEMAFKFGVRPFRYLGPNLKPAEAHARAVDLIRRRGTKEAVRFENGIFQKLFVDRVADRFQAHRPEDLRGATREALSHAPSVPEEDHNLTLRNYDAQVFARTLDRLATLYAGLGVRVLPEYARAFAVSLIEAHDDAESVDALVAGYERAVRLAVTSARPGLGLKPRAGHEYARELIERRGTKARGEIDAIEAAYRKLTTPLADAGLGLDAESALVQARILARDMPKPSATAILNLLEHERRVIDFLARPVRMGGLGYTTVEIEASLAGWLKRMDTAESLRTLMSIYEMGLVAYLSRDITNGFYDEASARQSALELVGLRDSVEEARGWLAERGLRVSTSETPTESSVSAQTPSVADRVAECVRLFLQIEDH